MRTTSQKQADAHDKMLDAAADLAEFIQTSRIELEEYALEELTIFLSKNAHVVRELFKDLKRSWI